VTDDQEPRLRRHLDAARGELRSAASTLRGSAPDAARASAEHRLAAAGLRLDELEALLSARPQRVRHAGDRVAPGELHRRMLLKVLALRDGADGPPADLERVLDPAVAVDPALVAAFADVTRGLAREYRRAGPARLLGVLRAHVDRAASHLDLPAPPGVRARLGSVVAEAACLTGWVLHVTGRRGEAHAYFVLGRDAARDAGDTVVQALATGAAASLFTTLTRGTPGGSRVAARLLSQAVALVPDDAPAVGRAWLHGRLAEELAALDDAAGHGAAVEVSRAAFAAAGDDRDERWAGVFSADGILAFWTPGGPGPDLVEAFGHGLLGDRRGVELLEPAVAREPRAAGRATLLGDLATSRLRLGDLEGAAVAATDLVDQARAGRVLGRVERARGLRRRLPDGLPAVRELDERLALL